MFEFDSARSLKAEENERKPNRYVASALRIGLAAQLLFLAFNEIGFFRIDTTTMRVCTVIGVICALIPQIIAQNDRLATDHRSKYFVLVCVCGMCFILSLALFVVSAPVCLLPLLFAVQYNSRRVSYIAIGASCLCVAVTPPLGCAMGLWDSEFLRFLLSSSFGKEAVVMLRQSTGIMTTGPLGVALYISLPWLMITIMLGQLLLSATTKGENSIEHQIKLMTMSRLDALTGLYNQNIYDQYLRSPVGEESVGVIFFDVDGLKKANDERGHEYGDLLLQRCAESLRELFDDNCHGFRIGGDEFLVVVDTEDPKAVEEKVEKWRAAIERVNLENRTKHAGLYCHMSVGYAFGKKLDLDSLIVRADKRMYEEKQAYHKVVDCVAEGR